MWAIIIKYEGETVYTSNGIEYLSNLSHIIILPKGCSYEWTCVKEGHYSVIEFDSPTSYDKIISFRVAGAEKLLKSIKRLEIEKNLKKEFFHLEATKEIYSIIIELLRTQSHKYIPSSKQNKISPALEYIALNYTQRTSNDTLAKLCGLSTVYFRKLFFEVIGMPPSEYINTLKIEKAKEILKSDYGSISDIASELGYLNIYDFSRAFKKAVGVSPKKFKDIY